MWWLTATKIISLLKLCDVWKRRMGVSVLLVFLHITWRISQITICIPSSDRWPSQPTHGKRFFWHRTFHPSTSTNITASSHSIHIHTSLLHPYPFWNAWPGRSSTCDRISTANVCGLERIIILIIRNRTLFGNLIRSSAREREREREKGWALSFSY